ncbi:MAG: carboxypeptidase-like regulatory domain-containing protein, partial [Paludibacter sp.]
MILRNYISITVFFLLLNFNNFELIAQNRIIGIVTDSLTHEALPFISVSLKGTTLGSMTDNSGKFILMAPSNSKFISLKSI